MVKKGKTPVWSREDAKMLLDSIPKDSVFGLRDRALIAAMFYRGAGIGTSTSSHKWETYRWLQKGLDARRE